jgi:hypothetical protein
MSNYKTKLLSLKRSQYVLYILILTLVMAFIWIGGTLLSSQRTSGITPQTRQAALPLNPNIDMQTFIELENKRVYAPEELRGFPIFMIDRGTDGQEENVVTIDSIGEETLLQPVFEPVESTETSAESPEEEQSEQTEESATASAQTDPNTDTQTQNEANGDQTEFVQQPLDFVFDTPPTE